MTPDEIILRAIESPQKWMILSGLLYWYEEDGKLAWIRPIAGYNPDDMEEWQREILATSPHLQKQD